MASRPTDEDQAGQDFREVTSFLAEKTISDCPACGASSWDVYGFERDTAAPYPVLFTLSDGGSQKFIRMIVAECKNCGFLRQHSYRAFQRWKDAGPEEAASTLTKDWKNAASENEDE